MISTPAGSRKCQNRRVLSATPAGVDRLGGPNRRCVCAHRRLPCEPSSGGSASLQDTALPPFTLCARLLGPRTRYSALHAARTRGKLTSTTECRVPGGTQHSALRGCDQSHP